MNDRESPSLEFRVQVVIEPDGTEFHAYCPALKGLHTSGNTEKEALNNAKDAAVAYIKSLIKHGDPIPIGAMIQKGIKEKAPFLKDHVRRHTEDVVLALP